MRTAKWVVVALIGMAGAGLILAMFLTGTDRLYTTRGSYDIAAGRFRTQKWLLWVCTKDDVRDSALTRKYRELVGPPPPPRWRYEYHSTLWLHADGDGGSRAGRDMELALRQGDLTPDAERAALGTFFQLLQAEPHSYGKAPGFARRLQDLAERHGKGSWITTEMVAAVATQPDP